VARSTSSTSAAPKRRGRPRKEEPPPRFLTTEQVRASKAWGPLLRSHIPGYDPCLQAEDCVFDTHEASESLSFFPEFLRHPEPPVEGQPFALEPWQASIVANLFGWKRTIRDRDGHELLVRRFKEAFIYVAKKNVKSTLAAGITLNVMRNAPNGAKLYGAAASQEQAGLVFGVAAAMVQMEPQLRGRLQIYGATAGTVRRSIVWPERMVSWRVLCADADTTDGVNPYFVIVDELHRHPNGNLMSILEKGTAAQREALLVSISTADYNRESPCNDKLLKARRVRDNRGDKSQPGYDPAFLPCLWEANDKDDWTSPATWKKANPNLGVSVTEEYLRRECQAAIERPSKLNDFKRFHLNIVTESVETFLPMGAWDEKCRGPLAMEAGRLDEWVEKMGLPGRACLPALDLGKTIDLNALGLLFEPATPSDPYVFLPYFWMPEDTLRQAEERDRVPYSQWVRDGFLEVTPGNVTDYAFIRDRIVQLSKRFDFGELAYDPWNATHFVQDLQRENVRCLEFRQGFKSYTEATKELERLTIAGKLAHGGHPVLRWCASNLSVERDAAGNLKPSKARSNGRIDGVVALCMGLGVSILGRQQSQSAEQALLEEPIYE
jgi:phage terminase large subunit-like protein